MDLLNSKTVTSELYIYNVQIDIKINGELMQIRGLDGLLHFQDIYHE